MALTNRRHFSEIVPFSKSVMRTFTKLVDLRYFNNVNYFFLDSLKYGNKEDVERTYS